MKLIVSLALAVMLLAATSAYADVSTLGVFNSSLFLTLNCVYVPATAQGGLNTFQYFLTSPVTNTDHIRGFTLQFVSVPITDFTITTTPVGWTNDKVALDNKLNWSWNGVNVPDQLDAGETFAFAFTTHLNNPAPSNTLASAQDGHGYSGTTCGPSPAIPEVNTLMLALMGLASVPGLRVLRRR